MSYFDELRRILKAQDAALTASRAASLKRCKMSPHKTKMLKRRIIDRLNTEDYMCRLPKISYLPEIKTDVYMTRSAQKRFIKKVFGFLPSNWMEKGILSEALFKRTQHCTGKVIKPRVRYKLTKCLHYAKYDKTVWTKETVYK